MSLETMTKLATTTVGAGGVASVTFSNIPQNYTDLKVVMSAKTSDANTGTIANIKFNSNTSSYSSRFLQGRGDNNSSSTGSTSAGDVGRIPGVNSPVTDNIYSNTEISILNYSSNTYKAYSSDAISEASQTIAYATMTAGLWSNPETITSITFTPSAGSFAQYSTFTIYGMKNAQKTAGNSIKATGGNVIFDGTYVTHTFNSTGAFTPTQPLVADVLTIAGGGCGGGGNGGGGGAGGLVYSPLQTLATSSYAITIGAGGSGGSTNDRGPAGSNSQFGALTAAIGGGGGGGFDANSTGANGGSGGGGGSYSSSSASLGGGTGSQGSNGGTGFNPGGYPYHGGGGGGAGAAGANATSLVCGNGGVGALYFGSYYAGGGGGGGDLGSGTTTFGTGGNGGGGVGGSPQGSASNGTINTGGGGGGEGGGGGGANGGSGVVIIRYKG